MKLRDQISKPTAVEGDDLFELTSLSPRMTGLPMTVWVRPSGNASHDARIKVNMIHGNHTSIENAAVVGIRPGPHLTAGQLSADDQRLVFQWIRPNSSAIIAYWNGDIDTVELVQRLKPYRLNRRERG